MNSIKLQNTDSVQLWAQQVVSTPCVRYIWQHAENDKAVPKASAFVHIAYAVTKLLLKSHYYMHV